MARMRALARLTGEEFEAAIAAFRAEWDRTGRKPTIERFITRRGDNTRLERETDANMARLDSTLRRIERDYEYDASRNGEEMRLFVAMMRLTWRDWAAYCNARLAARQPKGETYFQTGLDSSISIGASAEALATSRRAASSASARDATLCVPRKTSSVP
jgi:hypothetical protein